MKSDKFIHFDSPEAAEYKSVTLTGWWSRNGRFYGENEQTARYDGCTHRACEECGKYTKRMYTHCESCRKKHAIDRYKAMPAKEWDGESPLYSDRDDEWFLCFDSVLDHCEETNSTIDDLRLIIAKPVYAKPIDPVDYYQDDVPEDGDIPVDLEMAFEQLNKTIESCKVVLHWTPVKFRATFVGGE